MENEVGPVPEGNCFYTCNDEESETRGVVRSIDFIIKKEVRETG